jgi:hypothetical protein
MVNINLRLDPQALAGWRPDQVEALASGLASAVRAMAPPAPEQPPANEPPEPGGTQD